MATADLGLRARPRQAGPDAASNLTRVYTDDDDEFPFDWMKRIFGRALWSQRYFWGVASLCVALDICLTTIILLAVRCEWRKMGQMERYPFP